mmetsp:Transcript_37051/g.48789  ORF Transcript_37051/g.48789 Transcript_37051/m.48789 type:complete len:419 (+) Transcript_37051:86-1342(+)
MTITEFVIGLIRNPPKFSQKQIVNYGIPAGTIIFYYILWPKIKRKLRALLEEDEGTVIDTELASEVVNWVQGYAGMIGNTPMVRLKSLSDATGCDILAKVEYLNPGGTGKDRIALQMIEECEKRGILREGGTVVEGTSGSTGISLASLCRSRGYRCIIVMPDDQSEEKKELLRKFGAEVRVVKTASIANPQHFCKVAEELAKSIPGAVFMDQFNSGFNYRAHYTGTGPEIWCQTKGTVDAFVMGAGTGGTIAGVSKFLKKKNPKVEVFLVDPPGSSLYHRVKHGVCYTEEQSEQTVRKHRYDSIVEGTGLDRITQNFLKADIDDAYKIPDQTTLQMAHYLLSKEGLFVGSSTAINCVGAVLAAQKLGPGHTIVTILCDSGQRHMTRFWDKDFTEKRGLQWPKPQDLHSIDFLFREIPT